MRERRPGGRGRGGAGVTCPRLFGSQVAELGLEAPQPGPRDRGPNTALHLPLTRSAPGRCTIRSCAPLPALAADQGPRPVILIADMCHPLGWVSQTQKQLRDRAGPHKGGRESCAVREGWC